MEKTTIQVSQAIASMVLFNVGIIFSILSLHEIGHVLIGTYVGCESGRAIVFDTSQEGPYAELVCSNNTDYTFAYAGSLVLTTIFGVVFLFLRKSPQRNFFLVVIGFSILFASLDLAALFNMEIVQYVSIGVGMLLVIIGEFLTGLAYTEV
jgi:hypothetical protein